MTAGLGAVAEGSRMAALRDRAGRQVDVPAELQAIWYGGGPSRAAASGGAEPRGSDWDSMPGATLRLVAWMLGLPPEAPVDRSGTVRRDKATEDSSASSAGTVSLLHLALLMRAALPTCAAAAVGERHRAVARPAPGAGRGLARQAATAGPRTAPGGLRRPTT